MPANQLLSYLSRGSHLVRQLSYPYCLLPLEVIDGLVQRQSQSVHNLVAYSSGKSQTEHPRLSASTRQHPRFHRKHQSQSLMRTG